MKKKKFYNNAISKIYGCNSDSVIMEYNMCLITMDQLCDIYKHISSVAKVKSIVARRSGGKQRRRDGIRLTEGCDDRCARTTRLNRRQQGIGFFLGSK